MGKRAFTLDAVSAELAKFPSKVGSEPKMDPFKEVSAIG
jgi:hypothetical protein